MPMQPSSNSTLILYGIIGKHFEQFSDSKAGWGESPGGVQTLREFLLGLLFQMCFRAIAYLPEYVWASYKNNKVNSQPPSFRGSYFLNVFYEPP